MRYMKEVLRNNKKWVIVYLLIGLINYPGASTQALCSAPTSPLTALAFHSC